MNELEQLKKAANDAIDAAAKAAHAYFAACEVGAERCRAHDVWEAIHYARRQA